MNQETWVGFWQGLSLPTDLPVDHWPTTDTMLFICYIFHDTPNGPAGIVQPISFSLLHYRLVHGEKKRKELIVLIGKYRGEYKEIWIRK